MSKFKESLKFLVSFFLMFTIILVQLSFFTSLKVLNGDFYKDTLSKSEYFSLMRKDIDYGFKNLSMITSIPEKVFIDSVSNEAIKQLAYKNISSTESYMKYKDKYIDNKIDTTIIYNNLLKYVEVNNIKVDADLKNQLLAVSQDAGNIINNHTVLFNINQVDKYPQFQSFRKFINLLYTSKLISTFAILLMLAILGFLNKDLPRRMFLWVGSSFIPAAILTLIPSILALYYKIPNRFSIDSAYVKVALRDISIGYIKYFTVTGVVIFVVGVCSMYIYSHLSNKAYKSTVNWDMKQLVASYTLL